MQSTNRFALIKFTARYWLTHLHFKFSKDLVLDYNMLICGTIVRRIIIDFKRNTKNMSNIVFSVEIEFNNYSPHSPHQRISTRFQERLHSNFLNLYFASPFGGTHIICFHFRWELFLFLKFGPRKIGTITMHTTH